MIINTARRLQDTKEYYFSIKLKEIRKMISDGKDVINMAIGSPDLAPSDETISSLIEHVKNPKLHDYPPYQGLPELRHAISKWCLKTYSIDLDPEKEILPLIGSKEGITHISLTFLDPGDEVLVPELGYPAYKSVTELVGAKARLYPLDENNHWRPDLQKLASQDLSKVKLMWLNYPHMPTGGTMDEEGFKLLVDFAHANNILLCHDNPYSLILNTTKPLSILSIDGAKEVAIELHSFSKSHNMAGWRIGWLAGASEYINPVFKVKSNIDTGMFKPLQLAAAKALDNSDDWHVERNNIYLERKRIVTDILETIGCTIQENQVGMFVWAKLPANVDAKSLIDHILYNYNIFVAPGFIFGEKGNKFLRASLCIDADRLQEAKNRLQNFDISTL